MGGWLTPRLCRYTSGKETRYPFNRRVGGPPYRSGKVRKTSRPQGFDLRTIQLAVSRCTDYTISSHCNVSNKCFCTDSRGCVYTSQANIHPMVPPFLKHPSLSLTELQHIYTCFDHILNFGLYRTLFTSNLRKANYCIKYWCVCVLLFRDYIRRPPEYMNYIWCVPPQTLTQIRHDSTQAPYILVSLT